MQAGSTLVAVVALGASGCALYGGDDDDGDDAPHWPGEDLPACDTTRTAYRIDALELPMDGASSRALGWDFDGNGTLDNMGGQVVSAAGQAFGADLEAEVNETLADDAGHIVLSIDRCDEPDHALFELYRGLDIDRLYEPPRLTAEAVTSYAMVGDALPGAATDGVTQFPVGTLVHRSAAGWIDAPRFTVVVDDLDEAALRGRIVGAFVGAQVFATVSSALEAVIDDRAAANPDCTWDGCADSTLQSLMELFDTDRDWDVTVEEVRASSIVISLLAPDIDGPGPTWAPMDDGETDENDLYSIGVGFVASRVDLIPL